MADNRARAMRKAMAPQEVALWLQLRALRQEGWHWRRQAPEPPYILDFVCRFANLIVEVDGAHHSGAEQAAHDLERDAELERRGYRVLRFWASDVERELDKVVLTIMNALAANSPSRRAARDTLPASRGGKDHPSPSGEGVGRRPTGGVKRRYGRLVRLGLRKRDNA